MLLFYCCFSNRTASTARPAERDIMTLNSLGNDLQYIEVLAPSFPDVLVSVIGGEVEIGQTGGLPGIGVEEAELSELSLLSYRYAAPIG